MKSDEEIILFCRSSGKETSFPIYKEPEDGEVKESEVRVFQTILPKIIKKKQVIIFDLKVLA